MKITPLSSKIFYRIILEQTRTWQKSSQQKILEIRRTEKAFFRSLDQAEEKWEIRLNS